MIYRITTFRFKASNVEIGGYFRDKLGIKSKAKRVKYLKRSIKIYNLYESQYFKEVLQEIGIKNDN